MNPTREQFNLITRLVDEACHDFIRAEIREAYNPADLGCVGVLWCTNQDGQSFWQVEVEEAAPDATELRLFIKHALYAQGHPIETVLTAW